MTKHNGWVRPVGRPRVSGPGKASEGRDLGRSPASLAKEKRHTPRYPVADGRRRRNGEIAPFYSLYSGLEGQRELGRHERLRPRARLALPLAGSRRAEG